MATKKKKKKKNRQGSAPTNAELRTIMKFHLGNFNDEGVKVSDSTQHDAVLSDSDGVGGANSKAIYKAVMRWTFSHNSMGDPAWPDDWMPMTVAQLADFFIPIA